MHTRSFVRSSHMRVASARVLSTAATAAAAAAAPSVDTWSQWRVWHLRTRSFSLYRPLYPTIGCCQVSRMADLGGGPVEPLFAPRPIRHIRSRWTAAFPRDMDLLFPRGVSRKKPGDHISLSFVRRDLYATYLTVVDISSDILIELSRRM